MSQDQDQTEPVVPAGDAVGDEPVDATEPDEVEGFMFTILTPPTLGGPLKGPSVPPSGPAGPGPVGPDTISKPPRPGTPSDPFFPT